MIVFLFLQTAITMATPGLRYILIESISLLKSISSFYA